MGFLIHTELRCTVNHTSDQPKYILTSVRLPLTRFTPCFASEAKKIPGSRSSWRINFVRCCLIFVGPQCVTCLMSPFRRLEFGGGGLVIFFFLISGRLSSLTFAIMTAYSLVQWSARPPPSFKALVQLVFGFALSHLASILILKIQYISRCCLQNYVIN